MCGRPGAHFTRGNGNTSPRPYGSVSSEEPPNTVGPVPTRLPPVIAGIWARNVGLSMKSAGLVGVEMQAARAPGLAALEASDVRPAGLPLFSRQREHEITHPEIRELFGTAEHHRRNTQRSATRAATRPPTGHLP